MSAAVFLPDPLLSRAAPRSDVDGFDIETLLSPVKVRFARDRLLSPVDETADASPPLALTALDAAPAHAADGDSNDATSEEALDQSASEADSAAIAPSFQGQALSPELQALVAQRYREGFEEGMAQGTRLASEEGGFALNDGPTSGPDGGVASASRDTVLLLESLSRALQPLLLPDDAATRFEPLKRLALHLATELVRTELKVSPHLMEQLVSRSVQALQAGEEAPLTVELHPQDLALLRAAWDDPASSVGPDAPLRNRIAWREDSQLQRGSVRVRSDASTVEDLIEHRLASIMQDLRIQATKWQQDESQLQTEFVRQSAAAADVAPPAAPAPESNPIEEGDDARGLGDA